MAKMYLMSGCSGAGKTTYAKKFAIDNDAQYMCIDEFYKLFNGSEENHTNFFPIWIAYYQAIHELELQGKDVVVDTNCLTIGQREQFLEWFPTYTHVLLFIKADYDLCVTNNNNRTRKVPENILQKMYFEKMVVPTIKEEGFEEIYIIENHSNVNFVNYRIK